MRLDFFEMVNEKGEDMKQIDVHADDYGLTLNTSRDIMAGINAGKLNSISIMPNTTCFEETKEYFEKNMDKSKSPKLSVHLNFMEGYCVADKSKLGFLVNEEGLFDISWGTLVKYNYNFAVRNKVKNQLKIEIKAQLERVIAAYHLLEKGRKLRVDSHQHTHMIPMVMEALLEVIREEGYPTEYIRISKEPWPVYLKKVHFISSYRIINMIKVIILNWYSVKDEKLLADMGISTMLLSGVFLSGKMDIVRVRALLPELKEYADEKKVQLELLFHPGTALKEEIGKEFNHPGANEFYLSGNRQVEYDAMMGLII